MQQADGAAGVADGLLHVEHRGADLLAPRLNLLLLCRQAGGQDVRVAATVALS